MNSRNLYCPVMLILLAVSSSAMDAGAARLSVVFILSDDQGWTDYGFMGHEHIQAPNLDALAREGILYERGYVR